MPSLQFCSRNQFSLICTTYSATRPTCGTDFFLPCVSSPTAHHLPPPHSSLIFLGDGTPSFLFFQGPNLGPYYHLIPTQVQAPGDQNKKEKNSQDKSVSGNSGPGPPCRRLTSFKQICPRWWKLRWSQGLYSRSWSWSSSVQEKERRVRNMTVQALSSEGSKTSAPGCGKGEP